MNNEEKGVVFKHKFLIHNRGDNVGVAITGIGEGEKVLGLFMDDESIIELVAVASIPMGHKIAITTLKSAEPIIKYNNQIGITKAGIKKGEHVHIHNIESLRW